MIEAKCFSFAHRILTGFAKSKLENLHNPYIFFSVQEDKDSWIQAIQGAIDEKKDRQRTFESFKAEQSPGEDTVSLVSSNSSPQPSPMHSYKMNPTVEMLEEDIGTRAPRWIKDHETTACMCCSKSFNKLLRRRHHCRACGGVS